MTSIAFVKNETQQIQLMDTTFNLTDRERKFQEKSRAKDFASLYSSSYSRPNTPVNVIVGALILKKALGDTDDELFQALMFDIRYQIRTSHD